MFRFSIVIPAHNGEKYLRLAIESALNQTRPADEVVIVDDASTDATAEIAKSYGNKIKYHFNREATGFVDAWNRAIEQASGDFVTILHQDDLLHPGYLEHIERAINRFSRVKHFYTACHYIDDNGSIIKKPPEPYSLKLVFYTGKQYAHNYLQGVIENRHIHRCPGVITDREILIKRCSYRKEAGHIADDDFFLRVGAFTDVVGISYPLASYREHAKSQTHLLESLTLQLAKDYLFQTRYYKKNNKILDSKDIVKINQMAVRFINLLLFQSLLYKNKEWLRAAFSFKIELEGLINGIMDNHLQPWAKVMWHLTNPIKTNILASLYVSLLNVFRILRDVVKK
jgi:glycosyltransferase involved in cell wall biosynthesis